MNAIEARLHTLKELQDWAKAQMEKCESKEDNWVVIGDGADDYEHKFPIETEVSISESDYWRDAYLCKRKDIDAPRKYISKKDLENRKHLDSHKYNAFKEVSDKCEELINLTANSPANL